jgi:hypothetical protein
MKLDLLIELKETIGVPHGFSAAIIEERDVPFSNPQ